MKASFIKGVYSLVAIGMSSCLFSQVYLEKYFIAVQRKESFDITKLSDYTPLIAPKGKFYADPMLFEHNGVCYIFFEDYDYKKGVISYVTVSENLEFSIPELALELPCHLSFPHLFQEEGEIYMTPETYAMKEVGLYRATEFPHRWEKVKTLVQGQRFADPILFKYNDLFWLFTSTSDYALRVYFARDLMGTFHPHPINHLNISKRNAGRIFFSNERLFWPVMDCSRGYGWGVSLKEILELTPFTLKDRQVYHIEPDWAPGLDGTHTFNVSQTLVVYDGRRRISSQEDQLDSCEE